MKHVTLFLVVAISQIVGSQITITSQCKALSPQAGSEESPFSKPYLDPQPIVKVSWSHLALHQLKFPKRAVSLDGWIGFTGKDPRDAYIFASKEALEYARYSESFKLTGDFAERKEFKALKGGSFVEVIGKMELFLSEAEENTLGLVSPTALTVFGPGRVQVSEIKPLK